MSPVIYTSSPILCDIIDELQDALVLQPRGGDEDSWFVINFDDPRLTHSPSPDQVRECKFNVFNVDA